MVQCRKTKDNGRKVKKENFSKDRRAVFFPRSSAKCGNRSPGEAGQSLPLGVSNSD